MVRRGCLTVDTAYGRGRPWTRGTGPRSFQARLTQPVDARPSVPSGPEGFFVGSLVDRPE